MASAIKERLDVLDLFLQLPTAASGLQQRLADLPDTDRLLPKAAVAVRALLQHEEHVLEAHQQMEGVGERTVADPMAAATCSMYLSFLSGQEILGVLYLAMQRAAATQQHQQQSCCLRHAKGSLT